MAQLVETGQLTLQDIRDLETTLGQLEANRTSSDGARTKDSGGANHKGKRRGGNAK